MARELTFSFVDLAGFTAMTEAHGDEIAGDVADRLVGFARHALGPGDHLVKSIGDAVMCASPDPRAALDFVTRFVRAAADQAEFPLLRGGVHQGSAVRRGGDYFGAGVNVAARIASLARPGQIVATAAVAGVARDLRLETVDLGPYTLRNVRDEVELFEIRLGRSRRGKAVDPVCRMQVERDDAVGRLRYDGHEYWLCSFECASAFVAHPDRYAGSDPGPAA